METLTDAIRECRFEVVFTGGAGEEYSKKTSARGIKFIACEEAPATKSGYTYESGHQNDLQRVNGIRSHVLGDGNITIGIGIGIPVSDAETLSKYGLRGDMTHDEAQAISISLEDSIDLLVEAIEIREKKLNTFLNKHKIALSQHQFDALLSFTYNHINGGTTLWEEREGADFEIVDFIREGKGIYDSGDVVPVFNNYVNKNRRKREAAMFNGKGYSYNNNAVVVWFKNHMVSNGRPK
jgi:GH24 family phage-related lysozyme (muramidase)